MRFRRHAFQAAAEGVVVSVLRSLRLRATKRRAQPVIGVGQVKRITLLFSVLMVVAGLATAGSGLPGLVHSAGAAELPATASRTIDFVADVQPLLEKRCWSCHGSEKQESGLRLDRRDLMLQGGDLGVVLELGKSGSSRLIHYVAATDPDNVMPPEGERLTAEQVGILRAWIDQGCVWPESAQGPAAKNTHWAYQPLQVTPPPAVKAESWPINDLDRYVLAELEKRQIQPSPEASRYTQIRRLSLDLTGLLPTVEEVDAFVNDKRPEAYELLVDRLLASPHFGERWGRHWLDMARYADSDGYEKDNPRPDAYRWRDWVIEAINNDLPFDQFTVEQLAGDLLPEATIFQKLATAFHRQTLTNTEGGTDQEQFRVEACFDRTETTGTVWLGLTIGCARCHTHKYDAITQREYYQIFSVFNNGDETTAVVPKSEADIAAYATAKAAYDTSLAELNGKLQAAQAAQAEAYKQWLERSQAILAAADKNPVKLHALTQPTYSSEPAVTFTVQDSGAVLVGGDNPDQATYTIIGQTTVNDITAIRLDVLSDKSLPASGPGRVAHGNFVLTELTAEVASNADFTDARRLEFGGAKADWEQTDRPWKAEHVIDGKDETGWAIAPQFGKPHWLIAGLKQPLAVSSPLFVRVRLSHKYGQQHTIGSFKLSLQTGLEPEVAFPENIAAALKVPADQRNAQQQQLLLEHFGRQEAPTKELYAQLDELKKKEPARPELTARVLMQRTANPRKTYVLKRGEFLHPITELEVVPAGLATLPPLSSRQEGQMADRLDLARWLVSPDNPLTPRVTANHFWRILFGHGLVRTPNDFGVRGERPSHPELLDWLANELRIGSGGKQAWSRKALIKRIVMSATYRQSSNHRPELVTIDPENRLLARQNRVRVQGEIVRDISLDASGLLSRKIGGPSVYPPLPPGIAELSYAGNFRWSDSSGEDRYRRGMYTFFKRTAPHPNLITFDCPDANITCIERQTSNTPLQALTSLNNETFAETARGFARRMLALESKDDRDRLATAFRICVSRPATDEELGQLEALLSESRDWYMNHADEATKLIAKMPAPDTPAPVNAAWIVTARILLNLDEFITRE